MRLAVLVICCIVLALGASGRARAATEYCPAAVRVYKSLESKGAPGVFAYYLSAEKPRTVAGTLIIKASKGRWFSANIPESTITERLYHVQNGEATVLQTQFESEVRYVRLPSGVAIEGAYPSQVGGTECGAEAGLGEGSPFHYETTEGAMMNTLDPRTDLDVLPPPGTSIAPAAEITAPGLLTCRHPFTLPIAELPFVSDEASLDDYRQYPRITLIAVAIGANGALDDAWIFLSSGSKRQDDAAMKVVREGTFRAGSSFCSPAPGIALVSYVR